MTTLEEDIQKVLLGATMVIGITLGVAAAGIHLARAPPPRKLGRYVTVHDESRIELPGLDGHQDVTYKGIEYRAIAPAGYDRRIDLGCVVDVIIPYSFSRDEKESIRAIATEAAMTEAIERGFEAARDSGAPHFSVELDARDGRYFARALLPGPVHPNKQ